MNTKQQIATLKNENKLYEAMIRRPNATYEEKGNYGRMIMQNNKEIKELKKVLYQTKNAKGLLIE